MRMPPSGVVSSEAAARAATARALAPERVVARALVPERVVARALALERARARCVHVGYIPFSLLFCNRIYF